MDATAQDQRLSRIGMVFYFNVTQYLVGSVLYGIHIVLFVMCMTKLLFKALDRSCSPSLPLHDAPVRPGRPPYAHPIQGIPHQPKCSTRGSRWTLDFDIPESNHRELLACPDKPWRAWVLYPGNYLVHGILVVFSSADIFLWVYAQALVSKHSKEGYEALRDKQLGTASSFLSLGTNVVATFCIGLKAWNHYRFTRRTSITQEKSDRPSQRSGMTEVTRILFVLIETGAIFAVVQLIVGVIIQVDMVTLSSLDLANDVINKAATYLAAILPTATIIIVRSNRSLESYSFTSSITPAGQVTKMSTIRFGESGPNETGFTTDSRVHHTDGNKSVNGSEKQEVV